MNEEDKAKFDRDLMHYGYAYKKLVTDKEGKVTEEYIPFNEGYKGLKFCEPWDGETGVKPVEDK